jgi:hypothetical protein
MQRLRRDLDAVRQALGSALIAAQAAAVRETRLAVLDQLRARLKNLPVEANHAPPQSAPGRLVYPALDVGAAGAAHCLSEVAYLPGSNQVGSVLDRWEHELGGHSRDEAGAERNWDFLVRYCRRVDLGSAAAARFLATHRELVAGDNPADSAADPAHAEERERALRWAEDHRGLAARLEKGENFGLIFQHFLVALCDRLLTPWDRALRARRLFFLRRKSAHITLGRTERAAIPDAALTDAAEQLTLEVQHSRVVHRQRGQDFAAALTRWRTWRAGTAWVDAVDRLEAAAERQRQEVEAACASWDLEWESVCRRLHGWVDRVGEVLDAFDLAFAAKTAPDEVTIRLTRTRREALNVSASEEAAAWIRDNWPPPGDSVEAVFALWELGVTVPLP